MSNPLQIHFPLQMNWENTRLVQGIIWNLIAMVFQEEALADRISMIGTELVENAIKYGNPESTREDAIFFSLDGNRKEIVIEVRNEALNVDEETIQKLDETIQWIRGYQNPFEAYVERLESASRFKEGKSSLGIVRMAYEGEALIDFYVDENDFISVSATIPLTG